MAISAYQGEARQNTASESVGNVLPEGWSDYDESDGLPEDQGDEDEAD